MAKKSPKKTVSQTLKRPPVIAVMGHIDHGKSSLLDYIRQAKVAENEAGGITQHTSAYEVVHKNEKGEDDKITFLDTPGHEAFAAARSRGATVADMAILVVAADDGVSTQTLEALESLKETNTPFVVAITKIDKDDASVDRAKSSLVENGVYIEGFGGDVSYAEVSSKTGAGVDELLETILLVAEVEELTGDPSLPAEGIVLESSVDPKKGMSATLLIKNGTLKKGSFVVAENAYSPVRILENFQGEPLDEASFSSPVKIIGFNNLPPAGAPFSTVSKKKDAEKAITQDVEEQSTTEKTPEEILAEMTAPQKTVISLIVKTDAIGSQDGVLHEIKKIEDKYEDIELQVITADVGDISENDVRKATGSEEGVIIIGFHVKVAPQVHELVDRHEATVGVFDIIYQMSEWLDEEVQKRKPRIEIEETVASAKLKRIFSQTKNTYVAGGKVTEGEFQAKGKVNIFRRENKIGQGEILGLQEGQTKVDKVEEGNEFGLRVETKVEIAGGDTLEAFIIKEK